METPTNNINETTPQCDVVPNCAVPDCAEPAFEGAQFELEDRHDAREWLEEAFAFDMSKKGRAAYIAIITLDEETGKARIRDVLVGTCSTWSMFQAALRSICTAVCNGDEWKLVKCIFEFLLKNLSLKKGGKDDE